VPLPNLPHALTSTCWISQSSVFATNSVLFISDGESVVIDPGITPVELDALREFVAARGPVVRALVLTHAHWDHLLGPAHFPEAPVLAQRAYASVLRSHTHHLQSQVDRWREAEGIVVRVPFMPPQPDYTFEQQAAVSFGDHCVQVMAAPGHAPDHCALYEPESRLLFAGDMLSDLEIPMVMDTFAAYRRTLLRLAALDVRVLVPGHGTPTADPLAIAARFAQDQAYLEAVSTCATGAVARGASPAETVQVCEHISFAQPDGYPNAHRWNIEQAYLEAGGSLEDGSGPMGWEQDWL
jgi:hydroxyacylglutathione hydrolase